MALLMGQINQLNDLPTITDASHSHSVYGASNLGLALSSHTGTAAALPFFGADVAAFDEQLVNNAMTRRMAPPAQLNQTPVKPKEQHMGRRLVQVFIADSNDNVPLDDAVLYSGYQKMTDLNDQELFFEIDIKSILAAHNVKRVTFVDKKVKERTENLEPAKIRDLKMVVVTVATF